MLVVNRAMLIARGGRFVLAVHWAAWSNAMIALTKPGPDWPTTIEDAVGRIVARVSDGDAEAIRQPPEEDLVTFASRVDLSIREHFIVRVAFLVPRKPLGD